MLNYQRVYHFSIIHIPLMSAHKKPLKTHWTMDSTWRVEAIRGPCRKAYGKWIGDLPRTSPWIMLVGIILQSSLYSLHYIIFICYKLYYKYCINLPANSLWNLAGFQSPKVRSESVSSRVFSHWKWCWSSMRSDARTLRRGAALSRESAAVLLCCCAPIKAVKTTNCIGLCISM